MPNRMPIVRTVAILCLAGLSLTPTADAQTSNDVTLIRGAKVFDGTRMIGVRDVLVSNGKIADVAITIAPPAGASVVDAKGMTLLPGLIDSHAHAFGDALEQALMFGVTTELDMFTDHTMAASLRGEQRRANVGTRADIYSAGTLVTAPKGHGTEYGMVIPTIESPDSAQAFVDARIAEGSDYIKIVYDDGRAYGRAIPTVSRETLRAVIEAAHKRGKLAVVHVGQAEFARNAIEAGADGLVHLFADRAPAADFARLAASRKAFVIPTLTVITSITGKPGAGELATDPRLSPFISSAGRGSIRTAFPVRPGSPPRTTAHAENAVRELAAAGVPILAGTDAPNPGTAHGVAMHREIELLVRAGLTPAAALASATSNPATAFRLADRGRIEKGLRADLLLVRGDPSVDILATREIEGVWKGGARVDRAAYAAQLARVLLAENTPLGGPVSSFDDGTSRAAFGAGWSVTTDKMAGGQSTSEMNVVDGGANGTAKSLEVKGTIVGPLPYAWGGVMFMPGSQPMSPADLSKAKAIEFWAKGDGARYRIMVFAQSRGMTPIVREFVAGADWKKFVFPFAGFDGLDGKGILGIGFTGGPAPGAFMMRIDEVVLR